MNSPGDLADELIRAYLHSLEGRSDSLMDIHESAKVLDAVLLEHVEWGRLLILPNSHELAVNVLLALERAIANQVNAGFDPSGDTASALGIYDELEETLEEWEVRGSLVFLTA